MEFESKVTYVWEDITEEFAKLCGDLKIGELVHDTNLSLFEAMSAIEMMDPKMDAGMLCNQVQREVLNLKNGIETGSLKVTDFTWPEIIGIMDETLASVATWLEGHLLAQTVFTNIYLHDPSVLKDKIMRAFSLGTLKLLAAIHDIIFNAGCFEEEDFQPALHGFNMASNLSDARVVGMLREAEDEVARISKKLEANSQSRHHCQCVLSRVQFLRLLLTTLQTILKEKPVTGSSSSGGGGGVAELRKPLTLMSALLDAVKASSSAGIVPTREAAGPYDYPTIFCFEPLANQRLLPPTFPRHTVIMRRQEALEYISRLVGRLISTIAAQELASLHQLIEFFHQFSISSPDILSRSCLQLVGRGCRTPRFGSELPAESLRAAVRNFILPPALNPRCPLSSDPRVRNCLDAFFLQAERIIIFILRVTGANRARQRDKWGCVMEDLGQLQEEADSVDSFFHSVIGQSESQHLACFGTWALYHTLQVMIHYALSGFELELYSVHEYHYVYWYLSECMFNWLITTLSRADAFYISQENLYESKKNQSGAKNRRKKKRGRPHGIEIAYCQAQQHLCSGFYKVVVGLDLEKKLPQPMFDFDSEEVRFEHRFSIYKNLVTPPFVQYSLFLEMTQDRNDPKMTPQLHYLGAMKHFASARTLLESLSSPSSLLKVAKTNFVVSKLLSSGHMQDSQAMPEFDFSVNQHFPIIKLQ